MAVATSNTVAKKESNDVPAHVLGAYDDFDSDITLTSSDYRIPRLSLMQGTSKQVVEGDAKNGEYRKSSGQLIADKTTDLEFLIVKLDKYWRIKEVNLDGSYKKDGTMAREEWTRENDKRPWNYTQDGKAFRAYITLDVYLIIGCEDPQEVFRQIPMILSLQSTGYKAAQDMNTALQEIKVKGFKPLQFVFNLGRTIEGAYSVPTIKVGRKSTAAEMEAAAFFRNELKVNKVTTDEETGN